MYLATGNIRDIGPYGQRKGPAIRLYFAVFVGTLNGSMSYVFYTNILLCLSQLPRGLKRRPAATHLLRLWVQIPPGHGCLSVVSVVCCHVEVSATS